MAIISTDLLVVNRGGIDYKAPASELPSPAHEHALNDLSDVTISGATEADYFVYKNGKWTNEAQCNMKCNTYIPSLVTL